MGREHFAVSVHIYPGALSLLKKPAQIAKIMTGYHDERSLFDIRIYTFWRWDTEGLSICSVKKLHTFEIYTAKFHDKVDPLRYRMFLIYLFKSLVEPLKYLVVLIAQVHGMMGIGCHTLKTKQQC